jgi:hypothetical protein
VGIAKFRGNPEDEGCDASISVLSDLFCHLGWGTENNRIELRAGPSPSREGCVRTHPNKE